ncbi:MAG TPA: acyl-CoA dehydrogenase family protein [Turneriella sp.]|nr:acyl-CoA dehydrogenase family protein [Turneriella sp.]
MDTNAVNEYLAHVADFRKRYLESAFERSEVICAPNDFLSWREKCVHLGLAVPLDTSVFNEKKSATIFAGGAALQFYLLSLKEIAEANVSLALATHALLLNNALLQFFSSTKIESDTLYIHPHGRTNLARLALAHFLSGKTTVDDPSFLSEHFDLSQPLWLYATKAPQHILAPAYNKKTHALSWGIYKADLYRDINTLSTHGWDELSYLEVQVGDLISPLDNIDTHSAQTLLANLLAMQALVQVAVGAGALERALKKMQRYISERKQGGVLIQEHAAVRRMVGQVVHTIETVKLSLNGAVYAHGDFITIQSALSIKANLLPQMQSAANAALQAFGGYGFMRDYGMEKIMRDINSLALYAGTPSAIELFLSAYRGGI